MINILTKAFRAQLLIVILGLSSSVMAQQIVVVVNASNTENISPEMIKQIYSDKRNFWESGDKIVLFELPVKDQGREIFSRALLNKSAIASQSSWSNRYIKNTLKNQVKIKPQKLVAKFVSIHKSAIGYILSSEAKKQDNIKVIMTVNK